VVLLSFDTGLAAGPLPALQVSARLLPALDSSAMNDTTPDSTPRATPPADNSPGGRARLLQVAMRQFATQGFDSVTVRAIAAEAGVTAGLIKHHFGSKEGLRDAVDALFLQRTGAAFERAMAARQTMDPASFGDYERAWLVRYANEWPDFVVYLRRAIMENSAWGQNLFRRYYDSIRHNVDRMDAEGRIGSDVDRLWLPMFYAFLLLGPLILDPHIQSIMGKSTYEPDMWARYNDAFQSLFWQGAGHKPK
jgi:AcrR family transcriptional regulator